MKIITESNRGLEVGFINWIIAEREFVDVPDGYLWSGDVKQVYAEIRQKYYGTGEVSEALLSEKGKELYVEGFDYAIPCKSEAIVKELRRLWEKREASRILERCDLTTDHRDTINGLIKKLSDLMIQDADEYNHQKSAWETIDYIKTQKDNGHHMLGISSNLETLDLYMSGWQKKKTYIVGGMEKLGKTRFCLELAANWLKQKIGGIIFSMEMSENDIHECILANRALVNSGNMGTDRVTDEEIFKLSKVAGDYMNEPLYISTRSSVSPDYIRSVIRKQKVVFASKGYNVVWVIVDYIQRMVEGDDRAGKLEDAAKSLADIGRDEDVIMIVISQLSQAAEREGKNSGMSPHQFIKGSKGIREAADAIIVMYKNDGGTFAYVVQRKGVSNISVKLITQLEYARFRDEKAE